MKIELKNFCSLSYFIKSIIKILDELTFAASPNSDFDELKNFYYHILSLKPDDILPKVETKQIPALLRYLQRKKQIPARKLNLSIIMPGISDIKFHKFDIIFIPIFSSNWQNNSLQNSDAQYIEQNEIYDLCSALSGSKQIIITDNNVSLSNDESILCKKILHMMAQDFAIKIEQNDGAANAEEESMIEEKAGAGSSIEIPEQYFPMTLSASSIEMLMRAPYNFYCNKILSLQKLESINSPPNSAEFGSFVHKIFDKYCKHAGYAGYSKDQITVEALKIFKEILKNETEKLRIPATYRQIWKLKMEALAKEFVEFDTERYKICKKFYTEIKGSIEVKIESKIINLVGIADRIEIEQSNQINIIDYKTGTIPTKTDIFSGLSPQLIILAIILQEGGFDLDYDLGNISDINLHYVKIANNSPYIKLHSYKISKNEIQDHFLGLKAILESYMKNNKFSKEINISNFDLYL